MKVLHNLPHRAIRNTILLTLCFLLSLAGAFAQQQATSSGEIVGTPWMGAKGIVESVADIMARETVPANGLLPLRPRKEEFKPLRRTLENPLAPAVSQWPPMPEEQKNDILHSVLSPQTVGVSFLGIQSSESGYVPPDCMGDVGPTQVLVAANGRIKVFDKSGVLGSLNVADNTFWQSVRNGADVSDPHVRYDRISGRWFVVIINIPASGPNRVLIAVSSGSTITNTTSFTFYQFQNDLVGTTPNVDTGGFADYPTLGVDANALYIGANIFNASTLSYMGSSVYVVRKSTLLSGTLVVTPFRQLTNGSTAGPYTPQGVHNSDPTATEGYFIGVDAVSYSLLVVRRVSNPGGTPTLSGNINITVPTTTAPINQPAKSSTRALDALEDRLYAAEIHKNKITGVSTLWTAHNIQVNASGVGSGSGGRNGSRWYEIGTLTGTPALVQSGTVFDPAASSPRGFWIPSVAMSGQGHAAISTSYASVNDFAGIAVAGRYSSDAPGTTQSVTLATVSSTAYNAESTAPQRWGDYSQVGVDPNDDMTMWTFQEYCNAANSWGVRVIQLLAPPPATPASTSPASVATGASNVNVVLTGTSASGSGFFDPGADFPNRLSATVNGGGVTVNSITFTGPTSITLNLTVAAGAITGSRTITVTNPDGQSATSATGILTIANSGCPTITLSPPTLPDGSLGAAYSQSVTASGGTLPYVYTLAAGALPGGLTLSSGGLLSGTPTISGSYSFTVTATDSHACTGSQSYAINVGGCPTITLAPASLPSGTASVPYSQTITASGGVASYSFAVSAGTLPSGLTLSSAGLLSGSPAAPGTFNFTVTATDAALCTGSLAYSLTIAPSPGSTISLTALDVAYTQDFNTLASTGTSSTVPAGWAFSEAGSNAGTTYTAGTGASNTGDTYSFGPSSNSDRAFGGVQSSTLIPTIGASFTNNTGSSITGLTVSYAGEEWRLGVRSRFDTIRFQLSLDATSLTTGTWTPYSALDCKTPDTSGAAGARDGNTIRTLVNNSVSSLSIPNGATFWVRWVDANPTGSDDGLAVDDFSITPTGIVVPTNPSVAGTAAPSTVAQGSPTLLTAVVTPGTGPASTGITVTGDLGQIGGSASQQFFNDGSNGDVTSGDNTWSFQAIVLPSTPVGGKSVFLTVADAQLRSGSDTVALTVTVPPCPTITLAPSSLPAGQVNTPYAQTITASGGTAPYAFSLTSGTLPAGITLTGAGSLEGTTSAFGTFNITVTATDSAGCTGSKSYSLTINCPVLSFTSPSPSAGVVGAAYAETYVATGGNDPYSYAITTGTAPAGLALSGAGVLSGMLSAAGTYTFTVTATDSDGCSVNRADTIAVTCPAVTVAPATLADDSVGVLYSATISASGGTAPYTFAVTGGTLPTGLVLDPAGSLSGTLTAAGSYAFTVTATDTFGCAGVQAYAMNVFTSTITINVGVHGRWNLVSSPLQMANDSVSSIYPAATSGAFSFGTGGYTGVSAMEPGLGYWLKFPSDATLPLTGKPFATDTVDVNSGWNIVGSLSTSIPTLNVTGLGTTIESRFFGYSNGYVPADSIMPGQGYWVKVNGAGKLVISAPLALPATTTGARRGGGTAK